jgi:hypothetical protein
LATMLSVPFTCTYVGPYSLSNNCHLAMRSFERLPYVIFLWTVCAIIFCPSRIFLNSLGSLQLIVILACQWYIASAQYLIFDYRMPVACCLA